MRKVRAYPHWLILLLLSVLLIVSGIVSLRYGAVEVSFAEMKQSFLHFEAGNQMHQIIRNLRLPRILGGMLVGASFAASGALMQGITQNPLADSGLLGINAGAGLGLALAFAFLPTDYWLIVLCSLIGAGVGVLAIYSISRSSKRQTPVRLTLAGAGISALFVSLSQAVAIQFNLSQDITYWSIGGVSSITWQQFRFILPFFIAATGAALLYSSAVTLLRFGDDAAISLGKHPQRIRFMVSLIVLVLSGISVSVVGAVSFVGLIVPHFMRIFSGENYRRLLPLSLLGGALLVTWADFLARMINPPFETPFGIVTALIGIPFFIYLIRKGGVRL